MMHQLRIIIICMLIFISWGQWHPHCLAQEQTVTLNQVLKAAFRQNPSIEASRYEVLALDALVDQATSAYLPQFSNMTNYYRVGGDLPDMIGGLFQNFSTKSGTGGLPDLDSPLNIYNTNFFVSQHLYDFGKTSGNLDNRQKRLAAGRKDHDKLIADVVCAVKEAYFEMLKKNRLARVAKASFGTYEMHHEQAKALFESGLRPRIDVTKSLVDKAKSKLKLIKAEFAVQTARVDLENIIGGPPVEGAYALAEISTLPGMPTDIDPLVEAALMNRAEIASLKDRILAAEAQLTAATSDYWPTVSANGGYGFASTEFPLKDYWVAGVTLKWEIFSGFRTRGEEKESLAGIGKLKANLRKMELDVNREVLKAFIGVNESKETMDTAKIALREATENMALAQGRYGTGVGDAIEFADAEMALTLSKNDLVDATYGYLQDLARLEQAVGNWRQAYGAVFAD
ncbi:MAG: TolC family protein [Deltaproteobacteria bacterium]|nr:TolC family protein [Deltaproteobacteria bacterium]